MKKSVIGSAVALALGVSMATATSVQAATLNFDAGVKTVNTTTILGTVYTSTTISGSWFSMDTNGDGATTIDEQTPISPFNGLIVDNVTTQAASGSHSGPVDGTENPDIDAAWEFFGNTGMHQTTAPVIVRSNDGAGNVELDFSGWSVTWNGIADIPMGGDTANFASDTGIATLTCAVDCADGDTYTLTYAAHVPLGDPSNFGGVLYGLNLTGTISGALPDPIPSAVPVPAAVWLFGSGLLGLVGVARRKKTAA